MIRKITLLSISFLAFISCTQSEINYINQPNNKQRYNSQIFRTITETKGVRYGTNVTLNGVTTALSMDVYQPKNDTKTNRPLVVLAHGGNFVNGDKSDLSKIASFLAKAGYVVASINYRLLDVDPTKLAFKKAVINAVVDMKAAVRYFNKDAATNKIYKINTSKIFIGGYSAGAITALHYAYVNNAAELKDIGGSTFLKYVNSKGGLEGKSGNANYSSSVKGIINISGALFNKQYINSGEPSLYSIHGTADVVVPYFRGNVYKTGILAEGSGLLNPYATSFGVTNKLKTIKGGKHDAFLNCNSCYVEIRTFLFSQL